LWQSHRKPFNHKTSKALCHSRVPFFIVEKSVVMVYNKLLNYAGVTGDTGKSGFGEPTYGNENNP
jgi:hypothetical protein